MRDPVFVYAPAVILEVKFTERYPTWLSQMVEHFGLMRSSSSKYSGGVLALGESCLNGRNLFAPVPVTPAPGAEAEELILAES